MSGKYDLDRDLAMRDLEPLPEPERQLCKHDWVGDDDCVYCRNEELESRLAKLREYLDTCEAAYERDMAEKDAEIDRLREGVKAIADHQRIIGGHMATMGSVYVMATRLIEKNERG